MKKNAKSISVAVIGLVSTAALAQTLTFSNTTPPTTVTLRPTSTLSIQTNGNVTAQCVLNSSGTCEGFPAGTTGGTGGGSPPTVSIVASAFSTTADTGGAYAPGTTFTLTPTVSSSAEICVRRVTSGTPIGTNWPSTVTTPYSSQTISLNTASSTYGFLMECFADGGSATSSTITVNTNAASGGGGPVTGDCPIDGSPLGLPLGYQRDGRTSLTQIRGLSTATVTYLTPFPQSGRLGNLVVTRGTYASFAFDTPSSVDAWVGNNFSWSEHQSITSSDLNDVYISISECPGDFRIPSGDTPPVEDETLTHGCRNIKFPSGAPGGQAGEYPSSLAIFYSKDGTSGHFVCGLRPGRRYYFNMINASPRTDGIVTGEHTCLNGANSCGIYVAYD